MKQTDTLDNKKGVVDSLSALSPADGEFLKDLRGAAMLIVVLAHLGGVWMFLPYSSFLFTLAPIFFFASGAGNYYSYISSKSVFLYYFKRINGLVVPYYLFCIVVLCFFVIKNGHLPNFDVTALLSWLAIRPATEITPFPIFQLWFLRTLAIVILASPLLFKALKTSRRWTVIGIVSILLLSSLQNNDLNSLTVRIIGHDFYRALFYSTFFIAGVIYYRNKYIFSRRVLFLALFFTMAISFLLVVCFHQRFSLLHHMEVPDLYFALTSTTILLLFLTARDTLLGIAAKVPGVSRFLEFLNKNSLSILILHTLAIYLCDYLLAGSLSKGSGLVYAAFKAILTLVMTFLFAAPFTFLSNTVGNWLLAMYDQKKEVVAS